MKQLLITQCEKDYYWYNNLVGEIVLWDPNEVFVLEPLIYKKDLTQAQLDKVFPSLGTSRSGCVFKGDCLDVTPKTLEELIDELIIK